MRQEYFLSSVIRVAQHSEATPLPASIRVSRQLFSGASTHLFVHRPRSLALTALPPTWAQLQFFISFISILSDLAPLARSLYISSSFQCAQLRSLLGASPPLFAHHTTSNYGVLALPSQFVLKEDASPTLLLRLYLRQTPIHAFPDRLVPTFNIAT